MHRMKIRYFIPQKQKIDFALKFDFVKVLDESNFQ